MQYKSTKNNTTVRTKARLSPASLIVCLLTRREKKKKKIHTLIVCCAFKSVYFIKCI